MNKEDFEHFQFKRISETEDVALSYEDVLYALEYDCRFFIQFFIGEELEFHIPDFHVESWETMTMDGILKIALALPRGHAKTTLMKLCCIWHFLFRHYRFILYVSNTQPVASEACKDIANYLRCDNFVAMFGVVIFSMEQDQKGQYDFTLEIRQADGTYKTKKCILRARGAGQQVRGLNIGNVRPELACVDDLEDDDNTATPGLIKKLWTWFYGPFIKALSRNKPKIIYAGNMLSNKSLLHYFCSENSGWHSIRYGCIRSTGEPLWKDLWPIEAIRADFVEYQKLGMIARWFAEMMNLPMAEGQGLILSEDIPYAVLILPGQQEMAFVTVDPAISQATYANDSAVVVHAYRNGVWVIAQYTTGKFQPDALFHVIVTLCLMWQTRAVGVESAGYQRVLEFVWKAMMIVTKQSFEICMVPHYNKNKTERLIAFCSLLRKKVWALQEGDFAVTEELLAYDPMKANNKDDLIDACSMGVTMTQLYMSVIMQFYSVDETQFVPKLEYEICDN